MTLIQEDLSAEASLQASAEGDAVNPSAGHSVGQSLRRQRSWGTGTPGPKGSTTVSRFAIFDLEVAAAACLSNSVPSSSSRSVPAASGNDAGHSAPLLQAPDDKMSEHAAESSQKPGKENEESKGPSASPSPRPQALPPRRKENEDRKNASASPLPRPQVSAQDVETCAIQARSHVEKLLAERNGLQLEAARLRNEEARSAAERLGADRDSLRAEVAALREALSTAGQQQAAPDLSEALVASQTECNELREQLAELRACHSAPSSGRGSSGSDRCQLRAEASSDCHQAELTKLRQEADRARQEVEKLKSEARQEAEKATKEAENTPQEREAVSHTTKELSRVQEEVQMLTVKLEEFAPLRQEYSRLQEELQAIRAERKEASRAVENPEDSDWNSPRASWAESPLSSPRTSAFTGSHSTETAQPIYPASLLGEPGPSSAEAPSNLFESRGQSTSYVTDAGSCCTIDPFGSFGGLIMATVSKQPAKHRKSDGGAASEGAAPPDAGIAQKTAAKEKAVVTPPCQQRKVSSTHIGTPPVAFLPRCVLAQPSPQSLGERLRSPKGTLQSAPCCSPKADGETHVEAACSDVLIRTGAAEAPVVVQATVKNRFISSPSSTRCRTSTSTSPAPPQAKIMAPGMHVESRQPKQVISSPALGAQPHTDQNWVSEFERRSQHIQSPQRQRVVVVPPSATSLSQPAAPHVLHHHGNSSSGTPGNSVATSTPLMAVPPKSCVDERPQLAASRSSPSLVATPRMSPPGAVRQMSPRVSARRFQFASQVSHQAISGDEMFQAAPTTSLRVTLSARRTGPPIHSGAKSTSWQHETPGDDLATPPAPVTQLYETPHRGGRCQAGQARQEDQASQGARAARSSTPRDGMRAFACSSESRLSPRPQSRRQALTPRALHDGFGSRPAAEEGIILPPPRLVESCLSRPPSMWATPLRKFPPGGTSPSAPLGSPGYAAELLRNGSARALTRSPLARDR